MLFRLSVALLCLGSLNLSSTAASKTWEDYLTELEMRPAIKHRVVQALTQAIVYMRDNYQQLNLDAITGLRIVQGQLHAIQEVSSATEWRRTEQLLNMINEIIDLSLPEVRAYDPHYYQKLRKLVSSDFWEMELRDPEYQEEIERQLKMGVVELMLAMRGGAGSGEGRSTVELLDEDVTDDCIQELLSHGCNVSEACLRIMTTDNARGYSATHQVYYFIILNQSPCTEFSTEVVRQMQNRICVNIYTEAKSEPKHSDIQRDLFMEQVGLCGLAGYYRAFSKADWIENILDWQRPEGCYGRADDFLSELEQLDDAHRFRRDTHHRVKREERIMESGCLCHRTTVAILALVQNYRYLVEDLSL